MKNEKGGKKPIVVSKIPSREDVIEIACKAEEYPNKKISLSTFIALFIPEEENYGKILDDMTSESGKIHMGRRVLEWFGYEGEYRTQIYSFKKMLKRNSINYREIGQKDKEIEQYPTISQGQEQYMRSLGISLEEVKDQNEELLDNNKDLKKKADNIQRKLGIAVEDRAPLPEDESKRERFVLMKRNDSDYYPYYTIRAQYSYTTRKLKTERRHFPNLKILLDFKCNPNSKTLYVRIKDKLKAEGVVFKGNNIDLEGTSITEDDLIQQMEHINDQKYDINYNSSHLF